MPPVKTPRGFRFAGVNVGIKAARRDLALVLSDAPCVAAACVTVNKAKAAPLIDLEGRLPDAGVRAVVINSGNANALTGPEGLEDVRAIREAFGAAIGCPSRAILTASTGVIGVRLPAHKIVAAAPRLVAAAGGSIESAAEAMMTTDTRIKIAARSLRIGDKDVQISALGKGSGMIAPQLATMIVVLTTDAQIDERTLAAMLDRAADATFNRLVVDGDMSTNDALFALANGLAGNSPITAGSDGYAPFEEAIRSICLELAKAIVEDGEGATKSIEVTIEGAPNDRIARELAKSVAGSNLVKASIFGADPNWGRVLATVGARVGANLWPIEIERARVEIQGVVVYEQGRPRPHDAASLRAKMRSPRVEIRVHLHAGDDAATSWGCDLSYDYVKINADYMSLVTASPEGVVARDDRLTNYSPGFKRALLVEALSYISRFAGKRAVISYGGAAMVKDSLKASFCNDVNLLRYAGLLPIVVHGGGPEIARTLEKLEPHKKSEFVDGVRVTDAHDYRVVEMVLTGRVNTELVSMMNSTSEERSTRAVGVSGKDGGLLRARKLRGEDGRDLGRVGEIAAVNAELLELLLSKQYVPVISPVGLGEDGEGYDLDADAAAAEVAIALGAEKLIYLADAPGIVDDGELVSELTAAQLEAMITAGVVRGGMVRRARSILRAIAAGVQKVHVVDGRTPHGVIAELFTDRGVGTLVTA
jgi:acetylglutamate kinase